MGYAERRRWFMAFVRLGFSFDLENLKGHGIYSKFHRE